MGFRMTSFKEIFLVWKHGTKSSEYCECSKTGIVSWSKITLLKALNRKAQTSKIRLFQKFGIFWTNVLQKVPEFVGRLLG